MKEVGSIKERVLRRISGKTSSIRLSRYDFEILLLDSTRRSPSSDLFWDDGYYLFGFPLVVSEHTDFCGV